MKRLACLLAAALLPATPLLPAAEDGQLLANPGFEDGMTGWINSDREAVCSISAEAAFEGKAGLLVDDQTPQDGARFASERFPLSPGQTVTLTFQGLTETGESLVGVMLVPFDEAGRQITTETRSQPPTVHVKTPDGNWQHFELQYVADPGTSSVAISVRSWTKPTGRAFLDNFSLKIE
jgi:hypothetical protein